MLKCADYDIVFREIPGEVSLALAISGCPNRCPGCHSPHLWEDCGYDMDDAFLESVLEKYGRSVTCVCFMGGDADPERVAGMASYVRSRIPGIKTAWYSGRRNLPDNIDAGAFDYIKIGPYVEACGGLDKRSTNQRLFRILGNVMDDITSLMWK